VTLSENAIWTSGTNAESGTATANGGSSQGASINASGQSSPSASHNCWTDAVHPRDNLHSPELFGTSAASRPSVNHDVLYTE
jgi:hypothetical protein